MTPRQLSMRLNEFGIAPKQMRFDAKTLKGYEVSTFSDVFNRYLAGSSPNQVDSSETTKQVNDCNGFN